jgi:hypothetical protein
MRRIEIEGLERIERDGRSVRLRVSTATGDLELCFPPKLWEQATNDRQLVEPSREELDELSRLRATLKAHAEEYGFNSVMEGYGAGEVTFDLVLRPAGFLAVTTGYIFTPVARPEAVRRARAAVREDPAVEQAYLVSVVAEEAALEDEEVKVLCTRDRLCTASRFEMAAELWSVLSEGLGWRDTKTYIGSRRNAGGDT